MIPFKKERLLYLADIVAAQEWTPASATSGFNMGWWFHPCGTPSCIAGFAAAESGMGGDIPVEVRAIAWMTNSTINNAIVMLDCWPNTVGLLFAPKLYLPAITPARAAAVLRHLAETGEIDWKVGK